MSQSKYIFMYIICMSGQIFELQYSAERFHLASMALENKGVFKIEGQERTINGSIIANVLNESDYAQYIKQVKPKLYIKRGVWYDGQYNGVVSYEPWKEAEIARRDNKLSAPKENDQPVSPEDVKKMRAELEALGVLKKI